LKKHFILIKNRPLPNSRRILKATKNFMDIAVLMSHERPTFLQAFEFLLVNTAIFE